MKKYCAVFLSVALTVALLLAGCSGGGGSSTPLSSTKAITAFSFISPAATGTIDENAKTIAVTVPYGTNVTALVATFSTNGASVKVGLSVQVSDTTPNDFTNPVSYIVTAADGSTVTYAVTVTIASSNAKAITAFSFTSPAATGTIDENAKTIAVTVPYGTDVTALVATFSTNGASVKVGSSVQVSDTTPNDFTNPVSYIVTAADGSTVTYAVTVTIASRNAKAITAFSFTSPAATGTIDENAKTIAVNEPYGTNITALVATFSTTGQSVTVGSTVQVSGVTSNNFTSPVTYTVIAADGSTQNYTVTVRVGAAQWAQTVTAGSSDSVFYSVSVSSDGSVYAAGFIYGTNPHNFGNSVTAAGTYNNQNIVLVKYTSSGIAQWAQTVIAGGASVFYSVSVASDGSVYAAGYIYGTNPYNFGNSVTAAGTYSNQNIVLVKYSSSGLAQWAQTVIAGSSESWFNSVSVSSDGSVYAAGVIAGTNPHNFGNSVTAAGKYSDQNIVLVKYSSSGVAQWAQTVTAGSGASVYRSVSAASDGSVFAAGAIAGTGTYNFGNSVIAAGMPAVYNIVLVKYDSSGVAQWAQTVTAGSNHSWFDSLSVASDGSVYAAGGIYGTVTYNFGYSVTAAGTCSLQNIVLVKYSSSGVAQWAQTVTAGSSNSWFHSVSVASDGSVYAAGGFAGTNPHNFGNSVTAAGTYNNQNIVLVKYTSSGIAQWAQTVTAGSSESLFNSVSVASDGSVFAAGAIAGTGTYNFGNSITTAGAYSNQNIVLVKYY